MNFNATCPYCDQNFSVEVKVIVGSELKRTNRDSVTLDVTADITEAGHATIAEHVASHDAERPEVKFDPPTEDQYTYEISRDGAVWETCDPPAGFPSIDEIKRAHELRP